MTLNQAFAIRVREVLKEPNHNTYLFSSENDIIPTGAGNRHLPQHHDLNYFPSETSLKSTSEHGFAILKYALFVTQTIAIFADFVYNCKCLVIAGIFTID